MFLTIHAIYYNSVTTFLSKSNLIHLKKSLNLVYIVSSHSLVSSSSFCSVIIITLYLVGWTCWQPRSSQMQLVLCSSHSAYRDLNTPHRCSLFALRLFTRAPPWVHSRRFCSQSGVSGSSASAADSTVGNP